MTAVAVLLVAGFFVVVGRVYYLQTERQEEMAERSENRTERTLKLKAGRGSILDRNGVELAVTTDVPSIAAHPNRIDDPEALAESLAPMLDRDEETLADTLDSDRTFVWLQRKATPAVGRKVAELDHPALERITEPKRYYPLGDRAGQLLGFTGVDNTGLEGIERMMEPQLAGESYTIRGTRDARGHLIFNRGKPDMKGLEGNTVALTIDERIQRVAQSALNEQVEEYDAEGGYAVVMDVKSGDILAMANTPSFDPNRFRQYDSEDWRLRPITDTFEPGSVFKSFVVAAALEEEAISLATPIDCEEGYLQIGRHGIRDTHQHDVLNAAEVIQKSSNIGAYKIAKRIGKKRLYQYIRAFGFGQRTGLGIRGEQPGLVRPPDGWAEVTFANIAFGQGLTATPLQVTRALGALANDGLLLQPQIIKEVRTPSGRRLRRGSPTLQRRVVSEETAEEITRAMSLVTLEEGTGTQAALANYTVAGKTGTAQKVNPKTRRYDPDMWVASFAGYVPAEKPEFVINVMIDEPEETHYGGVVAAPAFKAIAKKALAVRGVAPMDSSERYNLTKEQKEQARWGTEEPTRPPEAKPDGPETAPTDAPSADTQGRRGPAVKGGVPDFRGMTLKEALTTAQKLGRLPQVEGWGRVVSQSPSPGRPLTESETLHLTLAPRTAASPASKQPASGTAE
jgi:cell division protein FtsI (penicillin-binding protein 3)